MTRSIVPMEDETACPFLRHSRKRPPGPFQKAARTMGWVSVKGGGGFGGRIGGDVFFAVIIFFLI